MQVTRFPSRAEGVSDRVSDFMAHLRMNGFAIGVQETEKALLALSSCGAAEAENVRLAFKAVCTGSADTFHRFDELFDAFWRNGGRVRQQAAPRPVPHEKQSSSPHVHSVFRAWQDRDADTEAGSLHAPDDGGSDDDAAGGGTGRLVASRQRPIEQTDLRKFTSTEEFKRAEEVAEKLGKALRHRRSRRLRQARHGGRLNLRKMIRRSLAYGGEPIEVFRKKAPRRRSELVAILDASGSMTVYARVFLAFLRGLVSTDSRTEAYLFHTRLVRVSDALRDKDTLRAVNRLSLLANGFGGGTQIGASLAQFNRSYASNSVTGRTVVVILSDGYDTDPPDLIAGELTRLRKRGCKIVWLNPLKGWRGYEPVAASMAAALPLVDVFASASTLGDLAGLEAQLARL